MSTIFFKKEGYILLGTMVVSGIMLMFCSFIMTLAIYEVKEADRWKRANEAYFLARGGIAESIYRLKTDYTNMTKDGYKGPNTKDLPIVPDDLSRKFSFSMTPVNPNEVHFLGSKYMTGAFNIETSGDPNFKKRGIQARIERDTFLRYSRFVQQGNLNYGANAKILADVYVGGDLNLEGSPVEFFGDVELGGKIKNQSNGIFHGDITDIGKGIDLTKSVDMDHYRDLSQGKLANEGTGLYLSSPVTINLSLFDFTNPNNPRYNGIPLPGDFNGIIFCEGDISLKGTLEGSYIGPDGKIQSGLTFISNDDIIATGNIRTGNTLDSIQGAGSLTFNQPSGSKQTQTVLLDGILNPEVNVVRFKVSGNTWDKMQMTILKDGVPMTRSDGTNVLTQLVRTGLAPENSQTAVINGSDLNELKFEPGHTYSAKIDYYSNNVGDTTVTVDSCIGNPVNIGLVAKNQLFIHQNTPKQLTLDTVILARDNNWSALGGASDHPNGYDANIWELTINGPIITKKGGDAGPWMTYGKRYYRYDMDLVENAPPHFPVPADWWLLAYWKHLKESEIKQ